MNLRQLRYFLVLAEELHFRRAAERLNITQSPLTMAIQDLERELGGKLFHRTQRRVELTEAGAAFRTGAREVLDRVQASLQTTRAVLSGQSLRLRLGLTTGAGLLPFLATTLQRFHIAHPDVRVTLHDLPFDEHSKVLQSHELDVCVVRTPLTSEPGPCGALKLLQDQLVVAIHRDHPLRSRTTLEITDLRNDSFIVYPRSPVAGLHEIVMKLCADRSFVPRIAQETRDTTTILGLCAARQGISIVPAELARIGMPDVHFVPLADEDAATNIHLAFRAAETAPQVASLCRIAEAVVAHSQPAGVRIGGPPEPWQRTRFSRSGVIRPRVGNAAGHCAPLTASDLGNPSMNGPD
jgi:DNA-binding transcriptional LysR family regulator